jgi:fatty acid desaturase
MARSFNCRCAIADRSRLLYGGRLVQVNNMPIRMTRSRLITTWYAAVALVVVAALALGAAVTVSTGAMLLALAIVPPVLVVMLWPVAQPLTASEVIDGANRRS